MKNDNIPFPPPQKPIFTFIDLFAGIGGFRLALQRLGGRCVFSSEIDADAMKTYLDNYGEKPCGDITLDKTKTLIPNTFDMLCGGFPCQPFSISGKKKGFEDTRGTLFFDICSIIERHKPKVCFLENVQNLINHNHGETFKVIIKSLETLGYNVSYKILNAKDFGLAQNRERIYIIASMNGVFDFNAIKPQKCVVIEDILDKEDDFTYLDKDGYTLIDDCHIHKQEKSGLVFVGYKNKSLWKKGIDLNKLYLSRCHRQPNRIYSIKGTHPTLSSQETDGRFYIYNPSIDSVRKLTPNECYKLMGFPMDFIKNKSVHNQYKQIGNSVAINVIQIIGEEIIKQKLLE